MNLDGECELMAKLNPKLAISLALAAGLALTACAQTGPQPMVSVAPTCSNFVVSIYFETDSATVTREAMAIIRSAAARARGCNVQRIGVIGLASAPGDVVANQALSERRVLTVTQALTRAGLSAERIGVGAVGEDDAMAAGGVQNPLRRRVDLALQLAPAR